MGRVLQPKTAQLLKNSPKAVGNLEMHKPPVRMKAVWFLAIVVVAVAIFSVVIRVAMMYQEHAYEKKMWDDIQLREKAASDAELERIVKEVIRQMKEVLD